MGVTKAHRILVAERRKNAVNMRVGGASWDTIAAALGYTNRQSAHKDVQRALEVTRRELTDSSEALRQLEVMRLDELQAALWAAASDGDVKAVDTALKVIDRRVKLLGLDAAQKVIDNAVDGWLAHLTGVNADPEDPADEDADADR